MGEIADYYVEQLIYGTRRRGSKSADRCKRCGSTDVKWRWMNDGWKLYDTKRKGDHNEALMHDCAADPDDFEDLTK